MIKNKDYEKEEIEQIDLKYVEFDGRLKGFSLSIEEWERAKKEGKLLVSDNLFYIDIKRCFSDPFSHLKTLIFFCSKGDDSFFPDSRGLFHSCLEKLTSFFPDIKILVKVIIEFFIFDEVRFSNKSNNSFYFIDSEEAFWNTERIEEPNLGHKQKEKALYSTSPQDSLYNVRSEISRLLKNENIEVTRHYHGENGFGHCVFEMKETQISEVPDNIVIFKYFTKNCAERFGKSATFMPSPAYGMPSAKMIFLFDFKGEKNQIKNLIDFFFLGVVENIKKIIPFGFPTTNSYKDAFREIRVKRIKEGIVFDISDSSANPYLFLSVLLLTALSVDGLRRKKLSDSKKIVLPDSMEDSLKELEKDCEFLCKNSVLREEHIKNYVKLKREEERNLKKRVNPYEYFLYYDI